MLGLVATLLVALPTAPSPQDVDRAVEQVLSDGDYQTSLPAEGIGIRWCSGNTCGGSGRRVVSSGGSAPVRADPDPAGADPARPDPSSDNDPSRSGTTPRDDGHRRDTGRRPPRHQRNDEKVQWRRVERSDAAPPPAGSPGGGSDFAGTLVTILLVVLGTLLALAIGGAIFQRLRRQTVGPVGQALPANVGAANVPAPVVVAAPELSLIERLALEGRYTEAIHELLRLAFEAASTQLDQHLPANATSRELVIMLPFHPTQRSALQRLVGAVEVGHFGKRELTEVEFTVCRQAFTVFEGGFGGR